MDGAEFESGRMALDIVLRRSFRVRSRLTENEALRGLASLVS